VIAFFKRFGVALLFLLAVIVLMLFGTYEVKKFGDSMLENTDVVIQPRGEQLNK
jgi:flagellar biogenesis protein FliO